MDSEGGLVEEFVEVNNPGNKVQAPPYNPPRLPTKPMATIGNWDEHFIGLDELCARYGYRSDYLLTVGVTTQFVACQQKLHGKNEQRTMMNDMGQYFLKVFGGCYAQDSQEQCFQNLQNQGLQAPMARPRVSAQGEVDMNNRLSFVPIPVTHVLRDGKKFFIDAKDIIVSDVVYLDSRISSVIPADIILFEASPDFLIANYLDTFDSGNKHFYLMRSNGYKVPESAMKKQGLLQAQQAVAPEEGLLEYMEGGQINEYGDMLPPQPAFILDSPYFVPMGVRFFKGQGKGIVVRIGMNTVKALLK